jgi:hypothetical protein
MVRVTQHCSSKLYYAECAHSIGDDTAAVPGLQGDPFHSGDSVAAVEQEHGKVSGAGVSSADVLG